MRMKEITLAHCYRNANNDLDMQIIFAFTPDRFLLGVGTIQ